jgi:hypothetical protein
LENGRVDQPPLHLPSYRVGRGIFQERRSLVLASHVNNRVLRRRLILVTGLFVGGFSGAALGAWTANLIQASRYNDPDWEWLDAALVALFSALLGLAGVDCSRCIIAVPPVAQRPPSGRCWAIARTLTRIAIGAVGLRLGAEAGFLFPSCGTHLAAPPQMPQKPIANL